MKTKILKSVSYTGLALSIVPALLAFAGVIEQQLQFNLMIAGMLLWFGTAIFWIKSD